MVVRDGELDLTQQEAAEIHSLGAKDQPAHLSQGLTHILGPLG